MLISDALIRNGVTSDLGLWQVILNDDNANQNDDDDDNDDDDKDEIKMMMMIIAGVNLTIPLAPAGLCRHPNLT